MKSNWITKISGAFVEKYNKRLAEKHLEAALEVEIERIARESKASFQVARNYKNKLMGPAKKALDYIDQNISHIPDPFVMNPARWGSDNILNTLFTDASSIRSLLHTSKALESFLSQETVPQAVALMTADWKQKTVMGIEMEGEAARRDVPKLALYFENHRIEEVFTTLDKAREGLRNRILNALIVKVVTDIQGMREWRDNMEKEKEVLEFLVHSPTDDDPAEGDLKSETRISEAKKLLAEIDAKEQNLQAQIGDPESQLEQVAQVLLNPQPFFSIQPVTLRLNRLGIVVKKDSDEPLYDVTLAQCELLDQPKRAIMWVLANR